MKYLRKYIRRILSEDFAASHTLHPKIESLIQRFLSNPGLYIEISGNSRIEIKMYDNQKRSHWFDDIFEVGSIKIKKYDSLKKPCHGAYVITGYSSMDSGYNLGPLLYDIAIELTKDAGLMPDRISVSDDAFSMWRKYLHLRDDVKWKQLDSKKAKWTKSVQDDCDLDVSFAQYLKSTNYATHDAKAYKKWARETYEDPLSKVFYKESTPVMNKLKGRIVRK
jgi:hypothetical protein